MRFLKPYNFYFFTKSLALAPAALAFGADLPCDPVAFDVKALALTITPKPNLELNEFSKFITQNTAIHAKSAGTFGTLWEANISSEISGFRGIDSIGVPRATSKLENSGISDQLADRKGPFDDIHFNAPLITLPIPAWSRPTELPRPIVRIEKPKSLFDERTKATLGSLLRNDPRLQRQSDPDVAVKEARLQGTFNFTPAEIARQAKSSNCSAAYRNLVTQFETNRLAIGFWTEPQRTVADFVVWYYQADLPAASRQKAAPIVKAQERFEKDCMERQIPLELNPPLVQRAVGILMFEEKVFCTALRLSNNEILTAKHCFVDPQNGASSADVKAVKANLGQMWFAYEAEPNHRFGVCKASLPNPGLAFVPSSDNVRIRISNTNTPPAPIKWAAPPIKLGTSLYLRGYFPFAEGATTALERLRSTSAGGCFAHSGADRCFFHACQTTPIMSGAPIFTRPEPNAKQDVLEVAGMHLGSALLSDPNDSNGSICTGIDGTKVPSSNFAYQP